MVQDSQWQETAKACLPLLYKVAHEVLHNPADAQDAVQQALMRTWEKRSRIQPESLRAYLTRATLNESRTMLRRQRYAIPVETVPERIAPERADLRPVMEAIAALPEQLKWPVWLKYLEDMSEKEAASALGLTLAAFRSRLHRARKLLRHVLEEEVTV